MQAALRSTLKGLLPHPVRRAARSLFDRSPAKFVEVESWQEATRAAGEYDVPFEYIENRIAAIRAGAAPQITLSAQLAAVLLPKPPVRVLDFGGSLGHSYFHLAPLAADRIASWHIIEKPETARHGAHLFADQPCLHFHGSIAEAVRAGNPDAVICSGVLQYIDDPYPLLQQLFGLGAQAVVLDRLPMERHERVFLQNAPGGKLAFRVLSEHIVMQAAAIYTLIDKTLAPREGPTENYFCLLFRKA